MTAKRFISDETINQIKSLVDNGVSLPTIGKIVNLPHDLVWKTCKRNDISLEKLKEIQKARKHIQIAENLFIPPLNKDQSWALGLLFTDGSIYRDRNGWQISIFSVDEDIVKKIHTTCSCGNHSFYASKKYTNKQGGIWKWTVKSTTLYERLNTLGLTERKTKTIIFPDTQLLQLSHFLRGIWDGDGTISILKKRKTKDGKNTLVCGVSSASIDFIIPIQEILKPITQSNSSVYKTKANHFYLYYTGTKACNLVQWLYEDSENCNRMNRKYEIALPYI